MSTLSASDLLTQTFKVPAEEVYKAIQFQQRNGGCLEQILVRMGSLSSESLPAYYASVYALQQLADTHFQTLLADNSWAQQLTTVFTTAQLQELKKLNWLPISLVNSPKPSLTVVTSLPSETGALDYLRSVFPTHQPDIVICSEEQLNALAKQLINEAEESSGLSMLEEDRLREMASEAPTVNLLNNLIAKGLRRRASDMHIEPYKQKGRVRYRIDGVLHEADLIPANMLLPVITRLKLLSKMDIAEKRRPQDGKIELRVDGKEVDIRVSALPVSEGESVVMRFLLQGSLSYDIKALGIEQDIEQALLQDIKATSGVILLTGPTGSGKTTSLYSFLSILNEPSVKIITIEDPVEYQLDGINQVQVQSDIGHTFANALRSVVRQDPDVIMVGEIRDNETASIALQSALTGHLVFSTLHTNDAPGAYTRLLDLGVEPFLLSAAVKVVVAQRLVRKLCVHCNEPDHQAAALVEQLHLQQLSERFAVTPDYRKAKGCEKCGHTGYSGRIAIIEYLRCDNDLRQLLGRPDFLSAAAALNKQKGFRNLLEDGILKAMQGKTTVAEVLRVAG